MGGAAPAIAAVAMVASGTAAATASATVAAGVFIGASTALACSAMAAAADSCSVGDFMDHGNWGTVASTVGGGVLGGVDSYNLWNEQSQINAQEHSAQINVPKEANDTYDYVQSHNGTPPHGFKGNRQYANDGRGGSQVLPKTTTYYEYDIHPYIKGQGRGAERIVIGRNGSGWYTNNHYKTFIQFR